MPLIFAASVLLIAIPATPILERAGAVAFGTLATAWLLLARAIVEGFLGYALKHLSRHTIATAIPKFVVDGTAIAAAVAIDPRLVWAALLGVAFSELFYTGVGSHRNRPARS
ncbi:MAG TPA: hypothetical protein VHW00_00830 [Thermoanaerobaculia bacterium]|nr:hypothetical protein [Thermoanaerobaculia bacterium]